MAVNGIGQYNYKNVTDYKTASTKETAQSSAAEAEDKVAKAADETAQATEAKVPQKAESYKPDMDKINAMKTDLKNNIMAFKQMVFAQVKDQGGMANKAGGLDLNELLKNVSPEEAQANIADDGYWGVEQTSNRILEFAKALAGGDPSKIAMLKDAVLKGFGAAEKVWGGKMPDISYQTKQKVLEGFDAWEKESAQAASGVEA